MAGEDTWVRPYGEIDLRLRISMKELFVLREL